MHDHLRLYSYDLAGNRTSVHVNGGAVASTTYNAANQVTNAGYSYDLAGNLFTDGTATSTYDALNRTSMVTAGAQSRTNTYHGDGALIKQIANGTTTYYTQDLAAPLAQILQTVQGAARRRTTCTAWTVWRRRAAARAPGTAPTRWAVCARRSTPVGQCSAVSTTTRGGVESGTTPGFGFTGEVQDAAGMVYLRARWYNPAQRVGARVPE